MERSKDMLQPSRNLPVDVLHRVLALLPLETLLRFRCVCKLWRSLPFSLLFADNLEPPPSSPDSHNLPQIWVFAFRLLASKVDEHRTSTYKSTTYTYRVAHDRELMGSSGYALALSEEYLQKSYGILLSSSSALIASLTAGVIDIVASANGLLLLSMRTSRVLDHEDNNLKLFVYNAISKDMRSLPRTQFAPQRLAIMVCRDGDETGGYKIYSLGRSYRPGTKYLLYSFEVFDVAQACRGWQFVSHVRANLSGSGDLHPGSETALMGYVNSKVICNEQGFMYWVPSFENGLRHHVTISSCHIPTGFWYSLPRLPFQTTFTNIWPSASGLMLVCGIAEGDDPALARGVEIWELFQSDEGHVDDEGFYGTRSAPQGTRWQAYDRMGQDLWDHLTCKSKRRLACAMALPLIFVVAEDQEDYMVVYTTHDRVWKLTRCLPLLHQLFNDKDADYFKIYPWMVTSMPNVGSAV